jgi:hypothetical protein
VRGLSATYPPYINLHNLQYIYIIYIYNKKHNDLLEEGTGGGLRGGGTDGSPHVALYVCVS